MRNSALSRERILKAAEEEFATNGMHGARVDEIAKKASINKRMIYEYFGNKSGLYTEVLKRAYSRLGEREKYTLEHDSDCVSSIKSIIKMYYDFLSEDPNFVSLIMWENLNSAEYIKKSEDFKALKAPLITQLRQIIARGKAQKIFKPEIDAEEIAILLITLSFSYFSNMHTLSFLLNRDLSNPYLMEKRVALVSNMVTDYICIRHS